MAQRDAASVARRVSQRVGGSAELASVAEIVGEVLGAHVPFDHLCLGTTDPDTHLITGHVQVGAGQAALGQILVNEYSEPDVGKFSVLLRAPLPVCVLGDATAGEPRRSRRYRQILAPLDFAHEARVALRDGTGLWGFLEVLRRASSAPFDRAEAAALVGLSPVLGRALRQLAAVPSGGTDDPAGPGPAVVLCTAGSVVSASAGGRRMLAELGPGGALPPAVLSAVTAAVAAPDGAATARVRSLAGRWVTVAAGVLDAGAGGARIAVSLQATSPARLAPLLYRAHGLTAREVDIAEAVWRHHSTGEIADLLGISPYTVQDHLKAIFRKVGVSSRRELLARLFSSAERTAG